MVEIFEIIMIVLFGISWPMNVIKSYKSKTTKGKSILFLLFIFVGYVCGIISKLLTDDFKWYVLMFYFINETMVLLDILLYFRNWHLEKKQNM